MRARFWVGTISKAPASGNRENGEKNFTGTVNLNAVQRKTGDNVEWASYTPSGTLTMNVNANALDWFLEHQGEDVYLDITPIPADE